MLLDYFTISFINCLRIIFMAFKMMAHQKNNNKISQVKNMKKTNFEKLAKLYATLADYNNGRFSRKANPKGFNQLNQAIATRKAEILKENKIKHGARLVNLGFSRVQVQNIFDDLDLNSADFQILDLI